jgi:hypothetical protein
MQKVIATALQVEYVFHSHVDLTHIGFEWGGLVVTLTSGGDKKVVTVKFDDVVGFRLLDEGDLLEFWPSCAKEKGWLFLIQEHGWFDLEKTRAGFLRETGHSIYEYFIASQNGCLSILSSGIPDINFYSI